MHFHTGYRCVRLLFSLGIVAMAAGWASAGTLPPPPPPSLDNVIIGLLENNCFLLGFNPNAPAPEFGPNLTRVCDFPTTGSGIASGGGSASPQGSTLSIESSLIQERLERAKKKKKGEESGSSSTASALARGRSGRAGSDAGGAGGGSEGSGFDIFASGSYESVDRQPTIFESAYDSSIVGGAVGFDYQFNDTVTAGLALGYRKQDGDFAGGGDFTMKAFEPSVFVSVLPTPKMYLQFVAGYGSQDSDVLRNVFFEVVDQSATPRTISGAAASSSDAKALTAAGQFGYDFSAGRFTFGPRVGVSYLKTDIDPYTESGGSGLELRVDERSVKSLQGAVGFFGSAAFSAGHAVLVPQLGIDYVHEFEDDANTVNAQFVEDLRGPTALTFSYLTNAPDSDFFNAQLGLGVVFARGVQMFVNVRSMFGNDLFDNTSAVIGVRFEL